MHTRSSSLRLSPSPSPPSLLPPPPTVVAATSPCRAAGLLERHTGLPHRGSQLLHHPLLDCLELQLQLRLHGRRDVLHIEEVVRLWGAREGVREGRRDGGVVRTRGVREGPP